MKAAVYAELYTDPLERFPLPNLATYADERERRWDVAHAIGHHVLHPGNQLWLRSQTLLAKPNGRQSEDFAYGLLVDEAEALREGPTEGCQGHRRAGKAW